MWKKALLLFSLFAFVTTVAVSTSDYADARKASSGKRSYNKTPSSAKDNVSKSDSGTTSSTKSSATTSTAATKKTGLFGGGSFMKGMMIGGLADMLFGSMLGTGFMSQMFGLLINVLAIFVLFMVIRAVYTAIKNRRRPQPPHTDRRW